MMRILRQHGRVAAPFAALALLELLFAGLFWGTGARAETIAVDDRPAAYSWTAEGAPTTGVWPSGALVRDTAGVLWLGAGGSPGTWSAIATAAALTAHVADEVGAHAATAISFAPEGLFYIEGDTVQAALEDVDLQLGNLDASVAAAQADATQAFADATAPDEGALLVGSSETGTGYGDGATVEERLDDLAGDVGTVAGAASTAQGAAGAAQADVDAHEADTTNPHLVNAAQVGAFPLSDLTADGQWIKATGAGTYAIEGAATTRSSLALATRSEYIAPGEGGMGTLSSMTATDPKWDATNRLPCVTFTASGDSATGGIGWSMILPSQFTAWGPTNVLSVGLQFSDDTGNNAASLTCKGTDGATALDAVSLTPSTSFGWVAVSTGSLEVGEAHAAGGIFSCFLSVTSDTADTIKFCGAYPTWTH